ncbi:MAG: hypothetical protein L0207_03975 [Chlamydiae bacterium]|nr:hypothetical protein [Chlamydiota bacterium]
MNFGFVVFLDYFGRFSIQIRRGNIDKSPLQIGVENRFKRTEEIKFLEFADRLIYDTMR